MAIISNFYSSEGIGVYTLALTYLGFFYLATDLGLNAYILPKLTDEGEANKLFSLRIMLSLFLVLLSCVLVFFIPIKSSLFIYSVLLGSISILFNGIFNSANLIFQKNLRYDLSVLASISGAVTTLVTIFYLSFIKVSLPYLILAPTAGWLVNNLVVSFLLHSQHSFKLINLEYKYLKTIFLNAWPISLTLLLNVFYFKIDTFILGSFFPISIVGEYNLAYQFFQTALVLPTFIMNSYYPLMLKNLSQNKAIFFKQIRLGSLILLVISLAGTALTYLLSPYLIKLVNGESGSILTLQLLSLGFPAFFVSALIMWALISLKKYKTVLWIYLFGLIINFILNLIFIPMYSIIAASIVTILCEYLILALLITILSRQSK